MTNHSQFPNCISRIEFPKLNIVWSFYFIQKLLMQNSNRPASHLNPAKCLIRQHELWPWHNYRKSKQPNFPYKYTAGGKKLGFTWGFPRISILHNSHFWWLGRDSKPRGRKSKDMWRKFSNTTFIEENNICFLHCVRTSKVRAKLSCSL